MTNPTSAWTLITSRPGVVLASVLLGAFVVTVTGTLFATGTALVAVVDRMAAETKLVVFTDPKISRADAEQVGERLRALPDVREAVMIAKEAALQRLLEQGFPAPGDGRNPLPDTWSVSLRLTAAEPDYARRVESIRAAAASIEAVKAARTDDPWVRRLAEWGALKRLSQEPIAWAFPGLAILLLGSIGWLAGVAMLAEVGVSRIVGTGIGMAVGVLAGVIGIAVLLLLLVPALAPHLPGMETSMTPGPAVVAVVLTAVAMGIGTTSSIRSR